MILGIRVCHKRWKGIYKDFFDFVMIGILILIEEIVILIVLTEEGITSFPHMLLFCYFQIFVSTVLFLSVGRKQQAGNYGWLLISVACPHGDVIFVATIGRMLILTGIYCAKGNGKGVKLAERVTIAFGIALWLLNCIQLPFYTNVIAGENQIQKDGIAIAEYLNEESYKEVYYFNHTNEDNYIKNFYGFL